MKRNENQKGRASGFVVRRSGSFPGVVAAVVCLGFHAAPACAAAPASTAPATREQVAPGLYLYKGCVNTAVFERNGKKLLIDPGELNAAPDGGSVDWVLMTHHHRDQGSNVGRLIESGARLAVPAAEAKLFSDADGFWKAQEHAWRNFHPTRFTLRENVAVARALSDGDVLEWEGLAFRVIETPGHTDGSVTYLMELAGKAALVTGSATGIGRATALALARRGCAVAINYTRI